MTDLSEAQDLNISAFWRVLPQDLDPVETREWIDALNQIVEIEGPERATFILMKLIEQARRLCGCLCHRS
jgi:pyruvate dehydrogenase complex dehydrogenase (E1) component